MSYLVSKACKSDFIACLCLISSCKGLFHCILIFILIFFNACHCIGSLISNASIQFNAWGYLISFNGLYDFVAFDMISVPVNMSDI